jgi:hypothetical protein
MTTFNRTGALQALPAVEARNGADTARVLRSIIEGTAQPAETANAIADISNSATGTQIATAVNGILAVLRANKMIAP